jgi:hypothetical protein
VLPWSAFWETNYFGYAWPQLMPLFTNDFVRGAISGLGVVNVVAGFAELVPALGFRSRHGDGDAENAPSSEPSV